MNSLQPGDFVWLNIEDKLSSPLDYQANIYPRKNKIALCAYPKKDLFFLVNTKYYSFAADGMFELKQSDLPILSYNSWLNLSSFYEAKIEDYNASNLSNTYRLNDISLYPTILYKISKCSILVRGLQEEVCNLWKIYFNNPVE